MAPVLDELGCRLTGCAEQNQPGEEEEPPGASAPQQAPTAPAAENEQRQVDPGASTPLYADIQIAVEPGGTTLAAFVAIEDAAVGQCLVDAFVDMLFPLATGPPIAIRFPVQFGPM